MATVKLQQWHAFGIIAKAVSDASYNWDCQPIIAEAKKVYISV